MRGSRAGECRVLLSSSCGLCFELIADGRENLLDPTTLRFGEVRNLQIDVSGVTRLQIRIKQSDGDVLTDTARSSPNRFPRDCV